MQWCSVYQTTFRYNSSRQLVTTCSRAIRPKRTCGLCGISASRWLQSSGPALQSQKADTQQPNASSIQVHDIASALKVACEESVPITVLSTVRTIRKQKKHAFAKLGDGSTTSELQVLLSPAQSEDLATGAAVKVTGTLQPCPPGLQQTHELHAKEVELVGYSDPETYPIQKKYHTTEFLRTLPHLRLRIPWNGLLARLRSEVEFSCSEWFHNNGYIRAHPPLITSSDCEGAGEVFTVSPASEQHMPHNDGQLDQHFFRSPKYLTVSSQLHLEAYVHTHKAVWTLSPTFRAERSDTPRHLSEFYMLEAEIQTESLSEVMDVVESLLRHIGSYISNSPLGQEILLCTKDTIPEDTTSSDPSTPLSSILQTRWKALQSPNPYPRITYTEAITYLQSAARQQPDLFTHKPEWGISLALEHEKYLASTVGQGTTPIFVTDYPRSTKPFYMPPSQGLYSDGSRETVSSFDLLLPSLAELVGGSLREHRYDALEQAMQEKGVNPESLEWYLALRKYGSIPHGGFGMGFDRLLCFLSGENNVRDVVAWPRWVGRCDG